MIFKVGDIVQCLPGFKQNWDCAAYRNASDDLNYGGCGYEANKIFKIRRILDFRFEDARRVRGQILFAYGFYGGVFSNAVILREDLFIHKNSLKRFDFIENN